LILKTSSFASLSRKLLLQPPEFHARSELSSQGLTFARTNSTISRINDCVFLRHHAVNKRSPTMFYRIGRYLKRVLAATASSAAVVTPVEAADRPTPLSTDHQEANDIVAGWNPSFAEQTNQTRAVAGRISLKLGHGPARDITKSPQAYIILIRAKLGPEIATAELHASSFGYVVCTYHENDPDGQEYAEACRDHGPQTWHDVKRSRAADHLECGEIVAGWHPRGTGATNVPDLSSSTMTQPQGSSEPRPEWMDQG